MLSDCILDKLKCSPQLLCRSLNQVCPGPVEFKVYVCVYYLSVYASVCVCTYAHEYRDREIIIIVITSNYKLSH